MPDKCAWEVWYVANPEPEAAPYWVHYVNDASRDSWGVMHCWSEAQATLVANLLNSSGYVPKG